MKSGWLVKTKGQWFVTEEGKQAYKKFTDPEAFFRESIRLYDEWKKGRSQEESLEPEDVEDIPKVALTIEEVEELASQQIQQVIKATNPYEFQDLVADLLKLEFRQN